MFKCKINIVRVVFIFFNLCIVKMFSQSQYSDFISFVDTTPKPSINHSEFLQSNFKHPLTADSKCTKIPLKFYVIFYIENDGKLVSHKIVNKSKDTCTCEDYQKQISDELQRVIQEYNKVNIWTTYSKLENKKYQTARFDIKLN